MLDKSWLNVCMETNTTYKSAHATDWGTKQKLTTDALATVVGILEEYELALMKDVDGECHAEDFEIQYANEIVTVIDFLQKEIQKRNEKEISNIFWKDAKAKGWDKSNPAHRSHINGIIREVINENK